MSDNGKPTLTWEVVDVETAVKWLETNTKNRPVSDSAVRQYARDMAEGRWLRTTTPVKFDTRGALVDGQHRLWAVVESGTAVEFLVARDVNPEERFVQDVGRKRSVRDILAIEGAALGNMEVAIANRMVQSFDTGFKPTTQEQIGYYQKHAEAIRWVVEKLGTQMRGIRQAGVMAPVARAWYTRPHEKLARFLEVLRTGMMTGDEDTGAVLLRNYVLGLQKGKVRGARGEVYAKTERALLGALRGEKLTKLMGVSEEQFPLPVEDKPAKAPRKARLVKKEGAK